MAEAPSPKRLRPPAKKARVKPDGPAAAEVCKPLDRA